MERSRSIQYSLLLACSFPEQNPGQGSKKRKHKDTDGPEDFVHGGLWVAFPDVVEGADGDNQPQNAE